MPKETHSLDNQVMCLDINGLALMCPKCGQMKIFSFVANATSNHGMSYVASTGNLCCNGWVVVPNVIRNNLEILYNLMMKQKNKSLFLRLTNPDKEAT